MLPTTLCSRWRGRYVPLRLIMRQPEIVESAQDRYVRLPTSWNSHNGYILLIHNMNRLAIVECAIIVPYSVHKNHHITLTII